MKKLFFIVCVMALCPSLPAQTLWGGYLMNMQSKNNDSLSVFNAATMRTFSLGNAFTQFTGPTTSFKTFTLPNASSTILTSNSAITIAQGGTGTGSTLTGLLLGSASAFTAITSSTTGQVPRVTGANTFAFGALDLANSSAVTGTLPFGNGGEEIGTGRATAQTAANSNVVTVTVGGTDASYLVSANILVTTSGSEIFTIIVDYTDETSTARSWILPVVAMGPTVGSVVRFVNGAVPYSTVPMHIRAKASTNIKIYTQAAGTYTGCTYNIEGRIKRI